MVRFVLFIAWCVGNYVLGEIIIGPPSLILFLTVPYWVKPKVGVWTKVDGHLQSDVWEERIVLFWIQRPSTFSLIGWPIWAVQFGSSWTVHESHILYQNDFTFLKFLFLSKTIAETKMITKPIPSIAVFHIKNTNVTEATV